MFHALRLQTSMFFEAFTINMILSQGRGRFSFLRSKEGPSLNCKWNGPARAMSECGRFEPIIDVIDTMLVEISQLVEQGPCFRFVYRSDLRTEAPCVSLMHRSREYALNLSHSSAVILDYLARNRLPQSARQIAAGVRRTLQIGRRSVKEYIKRIRRSLQPAF